MYKVCLINLFIQTLKKEVKKIYAAHYDLGNEFFSIWLDKTLTYSCGIFNSSDETLEKAQINKYNKLIDLIQTKTRKQNIRNRMWLGWFC